MPSGSASDLLLTYIPQEVRQTARGARGLDLGACLPIVASRHQVQQHHGVPGRAEAACRYPATPHRNNTVTSPRFGPIQTSSVWKRRCTMLGLAIPCRLGRTPPRILAIHGVPVRPSSRTSCTPPCLGEARGGAWKDIATGFLGVNESGVADEARAWPAATPASPVA